MLRLKKPTPTSISIVIVSLIPIPISIPIPNTVACLPLLEFKIVLATRTFYANLNGNNRSLRHFKK